MEFVQPHADGLRAARNIEAGAMTAVLRTALARPDLVAEFDRLAGTDVAARAAPLNRAIDVASGRAEADLQRFLAFAKDALWDRLDNATRDAIRVQVAAGDAP